MQVLMTAILDMCSQQGNPIVNAGIVAVLPPEVWYPALVVPRFNLLCHMFECRSTLQSHILSKLSQVSAYLTKLTVQLQAAVFMNTKPVQVREMHSCHVELGGYGMPGYNIRN